MTQIFTVIRSVVLNLEQENVPSWIIPMQFTYGFHHSQVVIAMFVAIVNAIVSHCYYHFVKLN